MEGERFLERLSRAWSRAPEAPIKADHILFGFLCVNMNNDGHLSRLTTEGWESSIAHVFTIRVAWDEKGHN